jgi:hypothetical protein
MSGFIVEFFLLLLDTDEHESEISLVRVTFDKQNMRNGRFLISS